MRAYAAQRVIGTHLHDRLLLGARRQGLLDLCVPLLDEQAERRRRSRLVQLAVSVVGAEQGEPPPAPTADLEARNGARWLLLLFLMSSSSCLHYANRSEFYWYCKDGYKSSNEGFRLPRT